MRKKHLFLGVLLLSTAIIMSGCGLKSNPQPISKNEPENSQNQDQAQEQEQTPEQNQADDQPSEVVNPSGSYSINELFNMNKPMKCTWKDTAAGDKDVSNILYIHNKNFYQDVTMGDVGHSYMIYNGDYLYIWNSFNDMASKMKNTESKTGLEPEQEKAEDNAGLDQKKDFICEDWVADDSLFIPPADKNFKDVTDEMNEAVQDLNNGGAERLNKQVCDQCKKAPTPELRAKCMGDIKCD